MFRRSQPQEPRFNRDDQAARTGVPVNLPCKPLIKHLVYQEPLQINRMRRSAADEPSSKQEVWLRPEAHASEKKQDYVVQKVTQGLNGNRLNHKDTSPAREFHSAPQASSIVSL